MHACCSIVFAMSFSTGAIGFAASYFPEFFKARLSAGLIFKILNSKSKIDNYATTGLKPV